MVRRQFDANSLVNCLIETNCSGYQELNTIELKVPSLSIASRTAKFATNRVNSFYDTAEDFSTKTSPPVNSDPKTAFQSDLVSASGFVNLNTLNNGSASIKWGISHDFSSLLLTPLFDSLQASSYSSIKVVFADKLQQNCYSLAIDDMSNHLIIDLISESGILITLKFNLFSDFSLPIKSTLSLINNWCFVSEPYDFNIRVPNFIRSINSQEFLILLKDGGILKCSRVNFNDEVLVSLFNDSSYLSSTFGKLGNLLPLRNRSPNNGFFNNDSGTLSKHRIPKNCSLKTVIDCFIVNQKFLVTITLNKKLVIWDILTGTIISETSVEQFLQKSELNDNLINNTGEPMCLLSRFINKGSYDKLSQNTFDFVCYLPVGVGQFKIWTLNIINDEKIELVNLGPQFEYVPILPDDNSIWIVQDFRFYDKRFLDVNRRMYNSDSNEIKYNMLVLMNSNSSTEFQLLTIFANGDHQWVKSRLNKQLFLENHPDNFPPNSSDESLTDFYVDKLLLSDRFSPSVIEACCLLFERKLDNVTDLPSLTGLPISEKISKIIGQLAYNFNSTELSHWQTFEATLMEFSKLSEECLCINYNFVSGELILSKAHGGASKLRLTEAIESLYLNRNKFISSLPMLSTAGTEESKFKDSCGLVNDATILRLIKALTDFKYSLPSAILSDFKTKILQTFTSETRGEAFQSLELIFNVTLEGKIPENALQKLMDELNSLPDAFKIFGYILEYYKIENFDELLDIDNDLLNDEKMADLLATYKSNISSNLIYSMEFAKQVCAVLEDLIYDLLLVTLILTPNDKTSEFILSESLNLYKRFNLFKMSCLVKLENRLNDEIVNNKNDCSLYDSLFLRIIVKYFPSNFQNFTINKLINFITSDIFQLAVLNELSLSDNSKLILDKVFELQSPYSLPKPVLQLFKGLSYLNSGFDEKAIELIIESSKNIIEYEPTDSELYFSTAVNEFSTESLLSAFYSKVSLVYKELTHFSGALRLIKLAIEHFNKVELFSDKKSALESYNINKKYHLIYYEITLSLKRFDEAFDVLLELQENPKFEKTMIAQHRYSFLTRFIEQIVDSKDLKKLNSYRFPPADIFKIDEILFRIADSITFSFPKKSTFVYVNSCMNQALHFFKILYSWRFTHGNIKGACEALYQYIGKYQYYVIERSERQNSELIDISNNPKFKPIMEKQRSEIKQLYLIILNSLSVLDDDKWLVKENFDYSDKGNADNCQVKNKFEIAYISDISKELENRF